jgi:hypothetical protein
MPLEILRPDELFGESAFLELRHRPERATVLESAKLMSWAVSEIEDLITKQTCLGVAPAASPGSAKRRTNSSDRKSLA